MGVLVAAVIGALILVGVLGFIKRKRRERQSQAEFHQDIFQEKNSFDPDMDRKSLGSGSLRMPMSPDGRTGLDVSHLDPSQHNNRYDYQGMNATDNIPMQNMTSYNSAPAGEQQHQSSYPTHHPTNDPQSNPNYQQQVDQLDFFGQPSPALTMVGPMTTDWSDQQTKCSPSEKQFPKSYIPEGEEGGDHRVTESPDDLRSGTPVNPNLQQSYLDCETTIFDRPSAMTTNNGDGGDHWKLECPQTSSPLGEIFIDHSFLDNHPQFDPNIQQHKDLLPPVSTTKALQVRNA
ncbi:hypothetical protein PSTG_07111 [Puccinia striiformis f. sp. tritici PST-78]|uniref:Uncharacterized protein n=1 Tax=Puccinia striiformis f. sp. tritici PST-78 TaxID=1165861 RepID=A0A0L0VK22_9BASI|nr:hypothetical protein PSTG_07111 [Puccinia striiformis f. sp. tritici PST-78]